MVTSFRYEARTKSGTASRGVVDAATRQAALNDLAGRGLFPTVLVPEGSPGESEPGRETGDAAGPVSGGPVSTGTVPAAPAAPVPLDSERAKTRAKRKEVTAFTRELATLLAAAIPITKALEGLSEQNESEQLRAVIDQLASDVRGGKSLSESMRTFPRIFPVFYTSMVEVGEESGAIAQVLTDLADLLESEDEMRSEVTSAVAYPVFVLVLGFVTAFVLLAFVLPRLFSMLTEMVEVLPAPTRVLLAVADFFGSYWIAILVAIAAAGVAWRLYTRTPAGQLQWDTFKLQLPILGDLFQTSALARFTRMLGTLERSGVPLLQGLEVVRNTVGNLIVSRHIDQVTEETRGGDSLAAPLRRTGLLPPTMVQMIAVGEETGQLDTMLLRVAGMQEQLLRNRSKALISLLGPALILVVGAVVGFIVIALLLPIFQMSQALR